MDFFSSLGSGINFNKKRFREDIEIFESKPTIVTNQDDSAIEDIPTLDFFNSTNEPCRKIQQNKKQKLDKVDKDSNRDGNVGKDSIRKLRTEAEVKSFRKTNKIRVYGNDVPAPFTSFQHLFKEYKMQPFIVQNIRNMGYTTMTAIQMQSMSIFLKKRDVLAAAPTGSGKTLSFLLPIIHQLCQAKISSDPSSSKQQALIIAPTRELSQQIYRELLKLIENSEPLIKPIILTEVEDVNKELNVEEGNDHEFDILITTPLRLVYAIQNGLKLDCVTQLILDEADKLLELGFLDQVDEIIAACTHPNRYTGMFSATIPSGVEALAKTVTKVDVVRVVIGVKNAAQETISQQLVYVGSEQGKLLAIRQLIQTGFKPPIIIFVQSIDRATALFRELVYDNINVEMIHSSRSKSDRDSIIENFRIGKIWVLIATDVLARGIDFKGVNMVINYDFPTSVESYIHRIGRTGRAGNIGKAVTYFTKEDGEYLRSVVNVMRESGCEVPEWMLKLKKPSQEARKKLKKKPLARGDITTVAKYDVGKNEKKKSMIEASKKRKKKAKTQSKQRPQKETNEEAVSRIV
ncbi:P-loop containing nucleoside triphosphate hydrolase protein [Paraphysoderma sedebokerense]|nr:P-loop containing nucleoside triphosphate hydrolase protein [Paraphysoderma sedebokerense]